MNVNNIASGTMGTFNKSKGRGTLYKLNDTSCFEKLDPVVPGVTVSNGLAWNRDGTKMYYIDSGTRSVEVFDYNLATATAGNVFVRGLCPTGLKRKRVPSK